MDWACCSLPLSKRHSRRKICISFRVLVKKCKYSGGFCNSNVPNLLRGEGQNDASALVSHLAVPQNIFSCLQLRWGSHHRSGFGFLILVPPPTASTSTSLGRQQVHWCCAHSRGAEIKGNIPGIEFLTFLCHSGVGPPWQCLPTP